jgi:asparagine synthase (glutamine-hydrolysing)
MQRNLAPIPRAVRSFAAKAALSLLPVGFKGRNYLQGLEVDLNQGLPLIATCFDRGARRPLMAARSGWRLVAESVREESIPPAEELLQRATRMDFENYLAEDILVKVDRASMLNSLEVRAPLLDFRIVEFAFGKVPPVARATPSGRKLLLKQLAARILPPEFDRQRKQGFAIPLPAWLKSGPWQTFFRDALLSPDSDLFDRKAVGELLDGQARGRSNSERLFGLVMFELWRREYGASL